MVNIMVRWCLVGLFTTVLPLFKGVEVKKEAIHPFYVSVVELNHNKKDKTLEVSIRIFTDDLEKTLKSYGGASIDLTHPTNKAAADKLLNEYIQHKLQIKLDGRLARLDYIGFEQQLESTWTYLEIKNVNSFKNISGTCSLLYDYQDKQINIFHIKDNGQEKSFKLDYPETAFSY